MSEGKPRHGLFVLLAVLILLTGALSAGVAAWAVAEPRTGEVQSAGVVAVPSVLGQTADEVLFYPWSMYDREERCTFGDMVGGELDPDWMNMVWIPLELLGVDVSGLQDGTELAQAMEGNQIGTHVYLRDFSCKLASGTAVTVNYAASGNDQISISFVVRPAEQSELSQERQDAALKQVKRDLRDFLCGIDEADGLADRLTMLQYLFTDWGDDSFMLPVKLLLERRREWGWAQDGYEVSRELFEQETEWPLEELIQNLEKYYGWSIQLITTPSQIVTVISNSGSVVGVYYDIQLGQYSGYGFQYG